MVKIDKAALLFPIKPLQNPLKNNPLIDNKQDLLGQLDNMLNKFKGDLIPDQELSKLGFDDIYRFQPKTLEDIIKST